MTRPFRQVVDLRAGLTRRFGDDASRDRYLEQCEAQRRSQASRFTVAPLERIKVASGVREAGQAITPAEVADHAEWRRLLTTMRVLERYDWPTDPEPPAAA